MPYNPHVDIEWLKIIQGKATTASAKKKEEEELKKYLLPYKMGSGSASRLAASMGILKLKTEGSKWNESPNKIIINWGNSNPPDNMKDALFLNNPEAVVKATNKLETFRALRDVVPTPEFSEDMEYVQSRVNKGQTWVARTKLNGHSGDGIIMVNPGDVVPEAPLYTKYIKKKSEYRVHVILSTIFDVQRKARGRDIPDDRVNWQVRSHQNGFNFIRENVHPRGKVLNCAVHALSRLGLHFGAVDIIYNQKADRAYVLEVNTAPGLEGTTLTNYSSWLSAAADYIFKTNREEEYFGYPFFEFYGRYGLRDWTPEQEQNEPRRGRVLPRNMPPRMFVNIEENHAIPEDENEF